MVKEFREKIEEIERAVLAIKDKIFTSAQSISFLVKEFKHIGGLVRDFRARKSSSSSIRRRAKRTKATDQDQVKNQDDEDETEESIS